MWSVTPQGKFKNYGPQHVFKKCKSIESDHEFMVMLEKPKIGFQSNEFRNWVYDKSMAKFRCNGLKVVVIFDLVDKITIDSIRHPTIILQELTITIYKVGEFVEPDCFDLRLENVCSNGIHYFLTPKAAKSYNVERKCCIKKNLKYNDDGYCIGKITQTPIDGIEL
jgi:hypothetical protein